MDPTSSPVIGIDLGTTNSTVAVVQNGQLTVIPVNGRLTMPSAVGIDPSGHLVIGQAAKNQAISSPENTVLSIKRLMGEDKKVELGGKSYRPEEISALILGELKRAAESFLGQPVTRAVITVPAFFNEQQRHATQDAGRLANLEVMRVINEPTAAALAYGAGHADGMPQETLLVYDLGGGTFDVSVVEVEGGVVEVRASHGDVHLGGDDFDQALAALGEQRFHEKSGDSAGSLPDAARRRLKSAMEQAKILLSDAPFAKVSEEYLTDTGHLETEVSRDDYEKLIEPWLNKTLDCLQLALTDAGVTVKQLSKVMLVGGVTRTPLLQLMLHHKLGIEPRHEIDPDLVVAMGAAIQGAALAGQEAPAILVDITAHTYSVAAVEEDSMGRYLACCPIVRRGTALPTSKAEVFVTQAESQKTVCVSVYQGESPLPQGNLKIGEFVIEGLSEVPAGNEIVLQFRIDLNGLLTATATEKSTGLAKSVKIDTAGQHRLNLDSARTNLAALFAEQDASSPLAELAKLFTNSDEDEEFDDEDADEDGSAELDAASLLASAKSLRKRAEKLLKRGVPETDATAIHANLAEIAPAIKSRDWTELQTCLNKLSDLLFYLDD